MDVYSLAETKQRLISLAIQRKDMQEVRSIASSLRKVKDVPPRILAKMSYYMALSYADDPRARDLYSLFLFDCLWRCNALIQDPIVLNLFPSTLRFRDAAAKRLKEEVVDRKGDNEIDNGCRKRRQTWTAGDGKDRRRQLRKVSSMPERTVSIWR
ncbi:MAG: hypothetical protein M1818_003085 [Claussenomyces sp. TS43310]|nr:MAG: hypothetical protein M1818_003085 [Claussenomyces sp. TS43310]